MVVARIRTTDAVEAADLLASGAHLQRHAHDMQLELCSKPVPAGWLHPRFATTLRVTPVDRPAVDVARASLGAYAAGHVDAAQGASLPEAATTYDRLLEGHTAGPLVDSLSALVIDVPTESVAAALIVTSLPGASWWRGGPWLADLFVVPRRQRGGLGVSLRDIGDTHAACS